MHQKRRKLPIDWHALGKAINKEPLLLESYFADLASKYHYTLEEENLLKNRLREGDASVRDELVICYLGVVRYVANRMVGFELDMSDLISLGHETLILAIDTMIAHPDMVQSGKGSAWGYIAWRLEVDMYRAIVRERERRGRHDSLNTPLFDESVKTLEHTLPAPALIVAADSAANPIAEQREQAVRDALGSSVSNHKRAVLWLLWGLYGDEQMSLKQAAELLQMSPAHIKELERSALAELRAVLDEAV